MPPFAISENTAFPDEIAGSRCTSELKVRMRQSTEIRRRKGSLTVHGVVFLSGNALGMTQPETGGDDVWGWTISNWDSGEETAFRSPVAVSGLRVFSRLPAALSIGTLTSIWTQSARMRLIVTVRDQINSPADSRAVSDADKRP